MTHISIGILPGQSKEQKKHLAHKLREVMATEMKIDKVFVSVSIEDLELKQWDEFLKRIPDETIIIPQEKR